MKPKHLFFFLLACGSIKSAKAQFNFTITNSTGSSSITCAIDTINVSAVSNSTNNTTYSWVSGTISLSGANVIITKPGNYLVTATSGTSSAQKNLAIGINTTIPVSASPSTFVVNGSSPPVFTLVAISPTVNITQYVYSPMGGTVTANSATMMYSPGSAGTYTHCIVNNANGCATCVGWDGFGPGSPATTTGILELRSQFAVTIYPNPGPGIFHLSSLDATEKTIQVFSLSGQLVKAMKSDSPTTLIDLQEEKKGIYFIKVSSYNKAPSYHKIVKE